MSTVKTIRKANVRGLIEALDGNTFPEKLEKFATKIGKSENQVRQWLSTKPIGDKLAGAIELSMGLEEGALDQPPAGSPRPVGASHSGGLDLETLVSAYGLLSDMFAEDGKTYDLVADPALLGFTYTALFKLGNKPTHSQVFSICKRVEKMRAEASNGRPRATGRAGRTDKTSDS